MDFSFYSNKLSVRLRYVFIMLSENDSEGNKLVQLGESILNQTFDAKNDQGEKGSESSLNDKLYFHVVQLSNFLQTLKSNNSLQESDVHQVLHFLTNVYHDLNELEKIPTPEVGPHSPVNESYKTLAYTLYILLKNHNIEFHTNSKEEPNIQLKKNSSFLENSSELLSFLADEYDLPRNLTEKEIISTIKEHKKSENSLSFSPKKDFNSEIKALKIQIENLQNCQKESEDSFKEKTEALIKINEVQKREIAKLKKQNQSLQSQVNMAITEALNISKSSFQDKDDSINRARLNLLEKDIESIKTQYDELKDKKHKIALENQKLKDENQKLIESEKRKDSDIIELKHALTQLQIENEQLNNSHDIKRIYDSSNTEIKIKASENEKLNSALVEISTHLKSLSSEISLESNRSNILYELSQKLIMALDKYDYILREKDKEAEKTQVLLNESQTLINNMKNQQAKSEKNATPDTEKGQIIDEIKQFLSTKSISTELNNEIVQIIDSPTTPIQKVLNLLNFLLNQEKTAETNKNLEEENDRLFDYCCSLLQFFEKLADSGELQQWIIGSPQDDTFRPLLLFQCSKIESFLKQYRSELNFNDEDFFDFPARIEAILSNGHQPQPRELDLMFHLCSTVNDSLRRYALNLKEENRALLDNVAEIRHELQQVSNECHFSFDEVNVQKSHESICSQTEGLMNPKFVEVLNAIENDSNESETIKKIIEILNIDDKKREVKSLSHENDKLRNEIAQLKQENLETNSQIKLILKENLDMKKNENDYQVKLSQLQQIIEEQKTKKEPYQVQSDNSELVGRLNEEIDSLKMKCKALEIEKSNTKSSLKKEFSKNLSKIQKEKDELNAQNDKLKNNYEKLLNELQSRLKVSLDSLSKSTEELKNANLKLSQINSELNTTRVENKMLKLKISTSDEKMQREKSLLETHFRMEKLNAETKFETSIEKVKAEYEKNFHEFLVSVCERFKDFFDFNQPISESSVQNLLNRVDTELKSEKDRLAIYELFSNEMNSVRSILGINDSEPILPIISKMVKKLNDKPIEFVEKVKIASQNDQTALEWEQWAKKLILMISDNLAPVQSSKYIQYAIEEAVMAGISQRSLIKKINILRNEKILLKKGKIYIKNKNKKLSLNSILLVLACIRRLQINSCHLPSNISKPSQLQHVDENKNDNTNFDEDITKSQQEPITKKKNYPIIT